MEHKYIKHQIRRQGKVRTLVGDNPVQQDKYYGWLYHKAQCKYRHEDYELTWADWDGIWTLDRWSKRGRHLESLCMIRTDPTDSWNNRNVQVIPRSVHLKTRCTRGAADDR